MKYRHKITGYIAIKENDKLYFIKDLENKIHTHLKPDFIEKGSDWELLDKPLFITEDNEEIYPNQPYWVLHKKTWSITPRIGVQPTPVLSFYIQFSTKDAAEAYKKLHKPNYSEAQMFEAFKAGDKLRLHTQRGTIVNEFNNFLKNIS